MSNPISQSSTLDSQLLFHYTNSKGLLGIIEKGRNLDNKNKLLKR